MDSIINKHSITETIDDLVNHDNEAYVAVQMANAKLSIAQLENAKLQQVIETKDEKIKDQEITIEELRKRVEQLQKRLQEEQEIKYRKFILQKKDEKFLRQISNKKKTMQQLRYSQYSTPNAKQHRALGRFQDTFYADSYFQTKTQYISPSIKQINSPKKLASPTHHYETDSYKRYRKQKIMACNNLDDILRVQKLID